MAHRLVMERGGALTRSGTIPSTHSRTASMKRQSIALFLSSLALAGGTVACGRTPDAGERGGDGDRQPLSKPGTDAPSTPGGSEGGEGGEGGEG